MPEFVVKSEMVVEGPDEEKVLEWLLDLSQLLSAQQEDENSDFMIHEHRVEAVECR